MTRTTLQFRGGGSADGLSWRPPYEPPPPGVVTAEPDGAGSVYVLDDQGDAYVFTGFGQRGSEMGRIAKAFNTAVRAERAELEAAKAAASAAKGCTACGRTFAGAAFSVAHDGGRCLPDATIESLLVNVSGVWVTRGSDLARR